MFNGANSLFMFSETCPIYGSTTVAVGLSSSCDGLGSFGSVLLLFAMTDDGYPFSFKVSVICNSSATLSGREHQAS